MSIDEIMLKPANWQYDDWINAKQQLLELLESCKPEERPNAIKEGSYIPVNSDNRVEDRFLMLASNAGYNKALSEYHSNIRKLFEVEE